LEPGASTTKELTTSGFTSVTLNGVLVNATTGDTQLTDLNDVRITDSTALTLGTTGTRTVLSGAIDYDVDTVTASSLTSLTENVGAFGKVDYGMVTAAELLSSVTMTSGSGSNFTSAGVTASGATISTVAITSGADSTNNFGTIGGSSTTATSVITSAVVTVGYGSTVSALTLDADTISSVAVTYNSGSTSDITVGTTGDKVTSVTMSGYATRALMDVNGASAVVSASAMTSGVAINSEGATVATITGGAGADTITGGTGSDSLTGGAGADTIVGSGGADTISGGAGGDIITVATGNVVIKTANTDSGLLSSTNLTELANGTATAIGADIDLITGFGTSDILSFTGLSGATINAAFTAGETPAGDSIIMIKGDWNPTAGTFDADATADATLVVWDSSIDGTPAYRAVLLIGYTGTDAATNVTYTGITGVA
jgi:Ca2+-binding RTX toxin-like protein